MDANEYQRLAGRTLIDTPDVELTEWHAEVAHDAVAQTANVGAIADYAKKGIFHKHGFDEVDYEELQRDAASAIKVTHYPLTDAELFAAWNVLGLCGEAGEVAALVDAMIANRQPLDVTALRKELGDVLWYVAALATKAGLELGDIMQSNIDKLKARYPDGYTAEASAARVDIADDRLCGGNPDRLHYYGINAEPCDLLCGAYICSACDQMGYTTCANCCNDGEED